MLKEKEVASYLAASDVFVFPSKTDTFGIVIIEALAAGVPVAAYPVTGPLDILKNTKADCLDWDLKESMKKALNIKKEEYFFQKFLFLRLFIFMLAEWQLKKMLRLF